MGSRWCHGPPSMVRKAISGKKFAWPSGGVTEKMSLAGWGSDPEKSGSEEPSFRSSISMSSLASCSDPSRICWLSNKKARPGSIQRRSSKGRKKMKAKRLAIQGTTAIATTLAPRIIPHMGPSQSEAPELPSRRTHFRKHDFTICSSLASSGKSLGHVFSMAGYWVKTFKNHGCKSLHSTRWSFSSFNFARISRNIGQRGYAHSMKSCFFWIASLMIPCCLMFHQLSNLHDLGWWFIVSGPYKLMRCTRQQSIPNWDL